MIVAQQIYGGAGKGEGQGGYDMMHDQGYANSTGIRTRKGITYDGTTKDSWSLLRKVRGCCEEEVAALLYGC